MFFCDAYDDKFPAGSREALVQERNRIRMLTWQDPADKDLKAELERLEQELRELDRRELRRP
jgi:hypothetical protein